MTSGDSSSLPLAPKKSKKLLLLLLLIMAAVGAYWINYRQPDATTEATQVYGKQNKAPIAVSTQAATQADVPVYLDALGTVTGLRTVTVRSRVDGELIRVLFKEGSHVKEGDLLAEIDPRLFQAQLMQSQGQLLKDEALLSNARLDLERYQTLLEQDSIASQQTATQSALVKQYLGTIETDKALVANAKLQLSYARITAPISGRLGLRLVDQGNIVHASDSTGLVVITQVQPISVVFTLPEDSLPLLRKAQQTNKGLAVEAYDRSGKNKLAQGQLTALDNQIDINTGTVKLKAQFANEQENLFSNQFVNVKLLVDTLHDAVLVPSAAIQQGPQGAFVFVVSADHTVTVRPVIVGPMYQEQQVVKQGLQAQELVVTDGVDKLKEGGKVNIVGQDDVGDTNAPAEQTLQYRGKHVQ